MTKIIGRLKDVGIGLEASRGAGISPQYWLPKTAVTIDDKVVKARDSLSYGVLNQEGNQAIPAKKWAEGDLEFDFMHNTIGVFLKAILGTASVSGPTSGVYTHTFSIDDTTTPNQHPAMSIVCKDRGIDAYMFRLAMLESLEVTIEPEEVVKVKASFMSKQGVTTTATASYTAEKKFVGRHLTFKVATLTSGLDGATHIPIKKLVFRFEKNLRLDHNLGTVEPEDIQNQSMRISGDVELDYEGRTYRDLMMDGSYRAVRIQLINAQETIGSGSDNPQFKLDLSRVDFEAWEPAYPNDEIASQSFSFIALHDLTNGNTINDCKLYNTVTSY